MREGPMQPVFDLLEAERSIILRGTFAELAPIAARKERLFARLADGRLTAGQLRRISAQVARNQTLLAAAMAGVQDVVDRLAILRRAADGFNTYDSLGQKSEVNTAPPAFERKA